MRAGAPTALVITPDFAPGRGGIQLMAHRVVSLLGRVRPAVLTLAQPGARQFDDRQPFAIRRTPQLAVRQATVLALNAVAAATVARRPPSVVLSMHVVTSPAAVVARRLGVPVVQVVHGHEFGTRPGLASFAVSRADRVVAVSRDTRRLALQAGADPRRIALIHPGVDPASGEAPGDRVPGPPTILTIARLAERYKGHDVILRALPLVRAKVPDARWRIVGDGPLRPALQARCQSVGLAGAVDFLGVVDDAQRDAEYARADVFCMVSRLAGGIAGEGFGIVYLEASAHGLPVVAGDAGGAPDAVRDGESGLLVDPEDHVAVADALITVLADRRLAQRLGCGGRALAEHFTWQATAQAIENELLSLVA